MDEQVKPSFVAAYSWLLKRLIFLQIAVSFVVFIIAMILTNALIFQSPFELFLVVVANTFLTFYASLFLFRSLFRRDFDGWKLIIKEGKDFKSDSFDLWIRIYWITLFLSLFISIPMYIILFVFGLQAVFFLFQIILYLVVFYKVFLGTVGKKIGRKPGQEFMLAFVPR